MIHCGAMPSNYLFPCYCPKWLRRSTVTSNPGLSPLAPSYIWTFEPTLAYVALISFLLKHHLSHFKQAAPINTYVKSHNSYSHLNVLLKSC